MNTHLNSMDELTKQLSKQLSADIDKFILSSILNSAGLSSNKETNNNDDMTRKSQIAQAQKVLDRCISIKRHLGAMDGQQYATPGYEEQTVDEWISEVSDLCNSAILQERRLRKYEMKRLNELWAEINFKFSTIK